MHRQPAARWLTASLVVTTLAAASATAQQKYRLRDTYSVGDQCAVETIVDVTFNVSASAQGESALPVSVVNRDRRKYSEVILAVDKRGPSSVRRVYTLARGVRSDQYGNPIDQSSSLQGKTVVLRRQGSKVTMKPDRGKLSPEDQSRLMRELAYSDLEAFPDREVAPGDEWTLDTRLAAQMYPEMQSTVIRYKFQEVVPYAGRSCARIHVTMDISGQPRNMPLPMTLKLEGDLYHALDLKRTVALEYSGPMTTQGDTSPSGIRVSINGRGNMKVKETRRWLKVRGKPVSAKG
jgi:hypothetical protein